jgi:hypothetical protein
MQLPEGPPALRPDVPEDLAILNGFPRPRVRCSSTADGAEVSLALTSSGEVRLTIYDVLGRQIKTLAGGNREAGYYTYTWDGRDELGQRTGPGVYFVRLEVRDGVFAEKIVLLK